MTHRRRGPGTALRLAAVNALLLAVVLGLVSLGVLRTFAAQSSTTTRQTAVAELTAFERAAGARPSTQTLPQFARSYLSTRVLPEGQFVVVAMPSSGLLGSAGSNLLLSSLQVRTLLASSPARGVQRHLEIGERHYLVIVEPMTVDGGVVGTVAVAANLERSRADLGRVRALVLGEAALALLAATAAAYLLLRRLLRRIGRITQTAAGIGRGELDSRLGHQGTDDEVGRLAATFDDMADRVADAMTAQRRLLSDVSHQLRTPLTVARGHLEVLERTGASDPDEVRDTLALVIDEIDHMKALVERLLMLGRAMEPDFLETAPVDLRSFFADLMDAVRVLAPRQWALSAVPDVVVDVDEAKLRGVMLNLVDNAVRATTDDATIAVVVVCAPDGSVRISVEDDGPGIPPERRQEVLQRFSRADAADSEGSGLGLAIATTVAEAHGGSLTLDDSALGGARVTIALPADRVTATEHARLPEEAPA